MEFKDLPLNPDNCSTTLSQRLNEIKESATKKDTDNMARNVRAMRLPDCKGSVCNKNREEAMLSGIAW